MTGFQDSGHVFHIADIIWPQVWAIVLIP